VPCGGGGQVAWGYIGKGFFFWVTAQNLFIIGTGFSFFIIFEENLGKIQDFFFWGLLTLNKFKLLINVFEWVGGVTFGF
jgi:hypothetical protein